MKPPRKAALRPSRPFRRGTESAPYLNLRFKDDPGPDSARAVRASRISSSESTIRGESLVPCENMESVPLSLVTALILLPLCARAVELHLQFGALERLLAEQLFTQEGRRYVRGSQKLGPNGNPFAYLERPRIQGDGRMKLRITPSSPDAPP